MWSKIERRVPRWFPIELCLFYHVLIVLFLIISCIAFIWEFVTKSLPFLKAILCDISPAECWGPVYLRPMCICYGVIIHTWWGIISGTPVTFCHNSGNYCPNLMILSVLWTEIIRVQAETKTCHCTLFLLLHYLAKTDRQECT